MNPDRYDTASFVAAVLIIVLCAIGATRIIDSVAGRQVECLTLPIKDTNGNKHVHLTKCKV